MASASLAQLPSHTIYSINASQSRIELLVFRGGILRTLGHDHAIAAKKISGEILYNSGNIENSAVHLRIDARALTVLSDPDLSEKDRNEVQATMQGAKVLNIQAFPQIEFHSTRVKNVGNTGEDLTLTGRLILHGVEKEITFPLRIHPDKNSLRATGAVFVSQGDFGITPIKGGLGAVRVKNEVKISFDILAEKVAP